MPRDIGKKKRRSAEDHAQVLRRHEVGLGAPCDARQEVREQRQQRAVGLGQARRRVRSEEQVLDTLDLLLKGAGYL